MTREENPEPRAGLLLLLVFLLGICALQQVLRTSGSRQEIGGAKVYVALYGHGLSPAVYAFESRPRLREVLDRAGLRPLESGPSDSENALLSSGTRVVLREGPEGIVPVLKDMSAFHKVTLGIPVFLNGETAEGLTAIPGIGPKTADAIVRERARRGGFSRLEDLEAVHGIGPKTLEKIAPYLSL